MTHPKFDEVWQVSTYQALMRRLLATLPAARSQPATEIDVERLARAIENSAFRVERWTDLNRGIDQPVGPPTETWSETTAERIAREYAALGETESNR